MNDSYRDAMIKVALTPAEEVRAPIGLADEIHRRLPLTPQRPRPLGARPSGPGWMPALSPVTLLLLLLLALTGIVAGTALLLTREAAAPPGVHSYHGGPGRTGVLLGPGPMTEPMVEWEAHLPRGLKEYTMPLVSGGTVYVVDVRGNALAFDLATGRERWSVAFPADVSGTPLIADGLLIAPADDGIARALDLATGEGAWAADLGARSGSSVGGWSDLALIGADDGHVHALEVASGIERWMVHAGGPVVKAPAIEEGIAYVVTNDGTVTAFDAASGEVLWTTSELGPGEYPTPAIHDGVLYVIHGVEGGDEPYELIALDVRDAGASGPRERWRWEAPTPGRLFLGAVAPDVVYVLSEDHNVYAIDSATGQGGLLLETGAPVGSAATIVGDVIYVASQDEHVYAIDTKTREVLWSAKVDGWPGSPVAAEGRLIVGTGSGQLISLVEPPTGQP